MKNLPITITLLAFLTAYRLLLMTAQPAVAAQRTIAVSPPMTEISIKPGTIQELSISIANKSADLISLEGFVRDFVAGERVDEPRILGVGESSSYSLKDWLLLSDKSLILQPNEERRVSIQIAVPKDAEPGGHYGLVGFAEPNATIGEGVGVKAGIASLFFVTVPGAVVEKASIDRFTTDPIATRSTVPLVVSVNDAGNVHVKPQGSIRVTNLLGQKTAELSVNEAGGLILPGSSRPFVIDWEPTSGFGRYQATVTLHLASGKALVANPITFWFIPMRQAAIGLVALILIILVGYEFEHAHHRRQLAALQGRST